MRRTHIIALIALLATFAVSWSAVAQIGSGYELAWNTIDNGGGASSHMGYTLQGTIGQPDTGTLFNGEYTLTGGFWFSAVVQQRIYLPLVLKSA